MCEECQLKKRKIASKGLVFKPLLSKDFNSRGQVDLVVMQSMRDGDILHYQDHLTKFAVHLYLYMSLIRAHTVLKLQEKKTHLLL
jgi:hypothetical protein